MLSCVYKFRALPGNKITGQIPIEFGNLSNLVTLDLENNRLSGEIPDTLGKLPKLQILWVAFPDFSLLRLLYEMISPFLISELSFVATCAGF